MKDLSNAEIRYLYKHRHSDNIVLRGRNLITAEGGCMECDLLNYCPGSPGQITYGDIQIIPCERVNFYEYKCFKYVDSIIGGD